MKSIGHSKSFMITISPTCLHGKNELLWVSVQPSGVFSSEKAPRPPDYPCKLHDHDHQWADLVMA